MLSICYLYLFSSLIIMGTLLILLIKEKNKFKKFNLIYIILFLYISLDTNEYMCILFMFVL